MSYEQDPRREPSGSVVLPSINQLTKGMDHKNHPSQSSSAFDPARDSGNWSMQSGQSKHSSTVSGHHLHNILNNDSASNRYSQASSLGAHSAGARYPASTHSALPNLSQPFDQRSAHSVDVSNTSFLDSRRSSVDSRVNVPMNHLQINPPSSPYEPGNNTSQSSLVQNLQHQRGIQPPIPAPRSNGAAGALSPLASRPRTATSGGAVPRRAPPIISNPRQGGMPDPHASTPTKGFAWAFPDKPDEDDDMGDSPSPRSSRQNSITASSMNTLESGAYHGVHGDPLQHKSVASLQGDHGMGSGNYSRTPELRVSHKLAERKRRSEMKDLFDSLNRILPNSPGNKSSKWEVLTKAIEYISGLKGAYEQSQRDIQRLKEELQRAHQATEENHHLANEITHMYQQLLRVDPHGHHVFGPRTEYLDSQNTQSASTSQPQPPQPPQQAASNQRLAPMQAAPSQQPPSHPPPAAPGAGWASQSSSAMQGIEYR